MIKASKSVGDLKYDQTNPTYKDKKAMKIIGNRPEKMLKKEREMYEM